MKINFDKKILMVILIILVVGTFGLLLKEQKIVISTDGIQYENGSVLRLKIKNHFLRDVCFSSCYPYYLEKKDEEWQSYVYQGCDWPDKIEKCVEPAQTRAFEILLPAVGQGFHRLAVPICENCRVEEDFQETKRFYSNEFELK